MTEETVSYEHQSFVNIGTVLFGTGFLAQHDISDVSDFVKNPMEHHGEIRQLAWYAYNACGIVTQTIDYMRALPTLDKVIAKRGNSLVTGGGDAAGLQWSREQMDAALGLMKHKELVRDCRFTAMVEGQAAYYFEVGRGKYNKHWKNLTDSEIERINEINTVGLGEDIKLSVKALPYGYYRIVGRVNGTYVVAFDLSYFDKAEGEPLKTRLLKYPKEIREAYYKRAKDRNPRNWVVLDHTKTIVLKIRAKQSERCWRH